MLISPALAHGSSGAESSGGGVFPLVLLAAAIIFVVVFVAYSKWCKFKASRENPGQ